jgi:hypothetical protein
MKKSELKALIREVIEEGGFFDDMDAAKAAEDAHRASKKELHYSIKKQVTGNKISISINAEFENPKQAKEQSDILARDIEAEMQKIIWGYNLNLTRI